MCSEKIFLKICSEKKILARKNNYLLGKIIICSEQSVLGNNVLGIARIFLQP